MILNFFYNIIISPIELLIEVAYTFLSIVVRYNPVFPIFGISILVTLCCLPLYAKAESIQKTERELQKKMKNKIASIKKHFKNDEQYMILSMYYRENKYHPIMSLRSTSSLLIQIPFFIAAYHFLSHLQSLKGTGFWFLSDLGKPDGLLAIGLPGNGVVFRINILPVIMTIINIISSYVYAKDYELKEKIQLLAIAAIFLILLYNSPSALVLYWTFNNIFSLIKNIVLKFKNPKKIFYCLILVFLVTSCIFVFFFRSQGKSGSFFFKLITICTALFIAGIPFYVKFITYLGKKYFPNLKTRINEIVKIFLLAAISIWILCAFVIPFNVISSDTFAFSSLGNNPNPFSLVFPAACIGLGLFVFWPCYIFFIFPKKTKIILSFVFSLFLLFSIINTFIFFGNNGTLSNTLTFLSDSAFNYSFLFYFINFLSLVIITIALITTYKIEQIRILISFFIILLLGGILITAWKSTVIIKDYETYVSIQKENEQANIRTGILSGNHSLENIQPVISLSQTGKNVVVIMLDRAVGSYFPLFLNEKPELNTLFSGFVYYPNTISFFRSTILGAPPIFGGYEYTPEELHKRNELSMADKNDEALLLMPILFKEHGYDVSVFDLPYVNYNEPMNKSFFIEKGIQASILKDQFYSRFINEFPDKAPEVSINYDALLRRNFIFFGIVSIAAPVLRDAIYRKGTYWAAIPAGGDDFISSGVISDYSGLYYLPQLCSYDNENDSLILMVNDLPHSPSFLQYPDYTIVSRISDFGPEKFNGNIISQKHYHVNMASYLLLAKWLDDLRENGVYNNTRIIIVSDHDELLEKPLFSNTLNKINAFYNPILLVKDFNTTGDLITDMKFMTNADVPLIATTDIIANPINPFTGKPLELQKENGVNIYLGGSAYTRDYPGWEALEKTSSFYHVKDNIFVENNWTRITKRF